MLLIIDILNNYETKCISFGGLCVGAYFMWKKNTMIPKLKSDNTN